MARQTSAGETGREQMSAGENKAVFLSYASQDADAARRICEALRAAGVEVWFDQSELRGGDAWDAKIRKQIKECALFVPIISANTQARREGYFRLEWKLAVDRSHLLADDEPFLVPVVIDSTSDSAARVPDKFREVQWTRLTEAERFSAFAERVRGLLDPALGKGEHATHPAAAGARPNSSTISSRHRRGIWAVLVGAGLAVALVAWVVGPRAERRVASESGASQINSVAAGSESAQHVAAAWIQMNKAALGRAELEIAEEHCRRALALNSNDPDALAAASQVDSWFNYFALDRAPARREAARAKAARALTLAPASFEARLAHACYLVRGAAPTDRGNPSFAAEAEKLLTDLLRERPAEPRALFTLGIELRNAGRIAEAVETLTQLARQRPFAALAWNEIGWVHYMARPRDLSAAEQAIDRSIALEPYWGNLNLKLTLALIWRGDVRLAKATLERVPSTILQEDNGVLRALEVFYYGREPEEMLRVLRGVARDWFATSAYSGPKAYWSGLAHHLAGRRAAAEVEWRVALKLVEQALAEQQNSSALLRQKARLLACLGQREAAEATLRLAQDMTGSVQVGGPNSMSDFADAGLELLLGHRETALSFLERMEAGSTVGPIRLSPVWDPLRNEPRFKAVLARVEAEAAQAMAPRVAEGNR